MPYCPRCGVELDASVRACPLCSTTVPLLDDLGTGQPAWPHHTPDDPSKHYATPKQLRSTAFKVLAAIFAAAALAVGAADVLTTGGFTWSRYVLAALVAALAAVASWLIAPVPVWAALWCGLCAGFLAAVDGFDGAWTWFPTLGLPVTLLSFGLVALTVALLTRLKRRGYNLFAVVFAAVAVELVGLDALITAWSTGAPLLGWSVVTSVVLVPLALLFFFLHAALSHTPDLRRTFHF